MDFNDPEPFRVQMELDSAICQVLKNARRPDLIVKMVSSEMRSGNLSLNNGREILWLSEIPSEDIPEQMKSVKCANGNHDGCRLDFVQHTLGCACVCHKP